jgi:hypothetical protein
MRVVYVGPHDAVEVPELGVAVRRDQPVEVLDGDAEALLAQDVWEAAPAAKAPAAKKGSDA